MDLEFILTDFPPEAFGELQRIRVQGVRTLIFEDRETCHVNNDMEKVF